MIDCRTTITEALLSSTDPSEAVEKVFPLVYGELRKIAASQLRGQVKGHSLQATDLVHQAYLRLFDTAQLGWNHKGHFFAAASLAMRRILIDHARRKQAQKRQPEEAAILPGNPAGAAPAADLDILALDDALQRLAGISPRQAKVVELLYFGGLTQPEAAEALDVSESTIAREWRVARFWLRREMSR